MTNQVITWGVKLASESSYTKTNNFYAGYCNSNTPLEINFIIWNNKYGSETVDDFRNFTIELSFDKEEDKVFFDYMRFVINNGVIVNPLVQGSVASINPDIVLSGLKNNGSDEFEDNYMTLTMFLDLPSNKNFKMNDLKTMSFNIKEI